jgi:hypothetical protein
VDVLAVMDELAATYGPHPTPFPKLSRVTEARAAVAELVAAANAVSLARIDEIHGGFRMAPGKFARLNAALARIGGAA